MRKLKIISFVWIFFVIFVLPVFGQQKKQPPQYRQTPAPATVHQISRHVYEVRGGSGANSAFIIGERSVYAVDAKMTDQSAKDMVEAIAKTTDKPLRYLILTHSDGDHVNGIPGFPSGIDIIAHENCAREIIKANKAGSVKVSEPDITFSNQLNLYDGDLEINLLYFGAAHTDGNIVLHIPDDNIAVIGDLFFKGMDPLIHKHKNGISSGFVTVLQKMADLNADLYLSGHAEPVKKTDIEGLKNTIIQKRDKVRALIKEGKNLDEIKKEFGIAPGQSSWPSLVEVIYGEMKQ